MQRLSLLLRRFLALQKKDFHELIINVIKRKRQMTTAIVMVKAFDTRASKAKTKEKMSSLVFTLLDNNMDKDYQS